MLTLNLAHPRLLKPFATGVALSVACFAGVAQASLTANPSSHDFGSTTVGTTVSPKNFIVTNTSTGQLELLQAFASSTTLSDALANTTTVSAEAFSIGGDGCSNQRLDSQAQCELNLTFKAQVQGTQEGELVLGFMDALGHPNSLLVALKGTGTAQTPQLSVDPSPYDFGALDLQASQTQSFQLSNTGSAPLNIAQLTMNAAGFALTQDACSNTAVAPNASCSVDVNFTPSSEQAYLATLRIPSNATPNVMDIALTGAGKGIPQLVANPSNVDFGAITQNRTKSKFIMVRNQGTGRTKISGVSLSGDSAFSLKWDGCTGRTVRSFGGCFLLAQVKVGDTGAYSAALNVSIDNLSSPVLSIPLSASAEPWCGGNVEHQFSSYPNPMDFGNELVGSQYTQWFTVFSWTRACDALKIDNVSLTGANADEFNMQGVKCYHSRWRDESYSSCYGMVSFKPNSAGNKEAQLTTSFSEASIAPRHMSLQASAVSEGQPDLSIAPTLLDFGEVKLGFASNGGKTLNITNTGNINLHLKSGSFSLLGEQSEAFDMQAWSCLYRALKPGQSCSIFTQFMPNAVGSFQSSLLVAAANNQFAAEAELKGHAVEPTDCKVVSLQTGTVGGHWSNPDIWFNPDGTPAGRIPTADDVVSLSSGTSTSLFSAPTTAVKALCVQAGAKLVGQINIQASDMIENHGDIYGLSGMPETPLCSSTSHPGSPACAQQGHSVHLTCGTQVKSFGKAGDTWWYSYQSGCPIVNTGLVKAGNGGNGRLFTGNGGHAVLLARGLNNSGTVQAGRGGDLIGTSRGQAGRGGSTQLWGKLGGAGHLYNRHGAQAIAGAGGQTHPNATEAQQGGDGGNLWLVSLPNVHLNGGIMKAGRGGLGVGGGRQGHYGFVRIEPNVIDLSGATTRIEGGDVTIYGGGDWHLDLSGASKELFNVEGDLTISVGTGGSVDLSGAADGIFKAGGEVRIFADTVVLDDERSLEDVIQAGQGVVLAPAKILYEASLNGATTFSGEPGETLTVNLVLGNNGATDDSYILAVAGSSPWTLGQFPINVDVAALDSVQLSLEVTLPDERGASNTLSFTALSQGDDNLMLQTDVTVNVNADTTVAGLAECPTEGTVSSHCNNRGRTLRNAQVDANVIVEGGELAGHINNQGTLSAGITVQADTEINGGVISGNVDNQGTLSNLILQDGNVSGGQIGGTVNAQGNSWLNDITLLANTVLNGGDISGTISGLSPEAQALLQNLGIQTSSQLFNLIIGDNVTLPEGVVLGQGVRFSQLANIPRLRELLGVLPQLQGPLGDVATLGHPNLIDLSQDVVNDGAGILARINALGLFKDGGFALRQNAETGALILDLPPYTVAVLPTSLQAQDGAEEGVFLEKRWGFRMNMGGGLSLMTQPAVQHPTGLKQALENFGLSFGINPDGDVRISIAGFARTWIMARPDWLGLETPAEAPLGLGFPSSPLLPQNFIAQHVYDNTQGQRVGQNLYPTLANAEALYAHASNVNAEAFGLISFTLGDQNYRGVLDYLVIDQGAGDGALHVEAAGDLNADNLNDWRIIFPEGETQILFALEQG